MLRSFHLKNKTGCTDFFVLQKHFLNCLINTVYKRCVNPKFTWQ